MVLIGLLILLCIVGLINKISNKTIYTEKQETIYVCEDDTLWSIAEDYKKPNQDIREYIYEIKKINNMENATIYEGQEITIIVYEEVK